MGFVTHQTAAAHFKEHGLDILMEMQRRERQQFLPWHWGQTYTGCWSMTCPSIQSIPKLSTGRMFKSSPVEYTFGRNGEIYRSVMEGGRRVYVDGDGPK